jgi:aspartate/methionine/tyrosine aminotransferase
MTEHGIYPKEITGEFPYPKTTAEPELEEELRRYFPDGHLVIANGAKQALAAVFKHIADAAWAYPNIHVEAPYWPSYPTLIQSAGAKLSADYKFILDAYPNNPDGRMLDKKVDILDAAYYSPIYTQGKLKIEPLSHASNVSVWSAAKLFGCSGVRVGWLHTYDSMLAKSARQYVEQTTSGVSVLSQRFIASTMKNLRTKEQAVYAAAIEKLEKNRAIFERLSPHVDISSHKYGMFAWFRPVSYKKFSDAIVRANVKLVTGDACGGSPLFFRMSLGHTNEVTEMAITCLLNELEK